MRKRHFFVAALLLTATTITAQTKDGGLSASTIEKIQKMQQTGSADKALRNAIAANTIDNLAKNAANAGMIDTQFSVETPKQSITDQKSSGRCWMFSGMNVLRNNYNIKPDSVQIEFSQAYLFFWDQLEKANLFLQGVIDNAKKPFDDRTVQFLFKSPLNDGGTFCGVSDLTRKYGLVPKCVMPETTQSDNTSRMSRLIASKLREQGLQLRQMVADGKKAAAIKDEKIKMLSVIYRMLSLTIGEPVKEFTYAYKDNSGKTVDTQKKYTPLSFYKEIVGTDDLNGTFIMVMNDPRNPYHKTYEVEYDRHTYDGHNWKYLNLPMNEIKKMAIAALKDGKKMYSSYDVGKCLDRTRGYADTENFDYESLFGTTFPMNKAQRIMTFDSGSTHAMTLTAVDLDTNGNPVKWKVENSWGAAWGQQGCLIMTDRWIDEYMFRLVVDKKYVPENLLKEYEQKPTMLTPDDPLFQEDL